MISNYQQTKLLTAKQVQEEYLPLDIRKVREFLNSNCKYRKIGNQYLYVRKEVEAKLILAEGNIVYNTNSHRRRGKRSELLCRKI